MKKIIFSLLAALYGIGYNYAEVDMSKPLIVRPETIMLDLGTGYSIITYLEILDSPNQLEIRPAELYSSSGNGYPKLTNESLYIGRNVVTKFSHGYGDDIYSYYPWCGENVIKEYILGEEATQFPVHHYHYSRLGHGEYETYEIDEWTLELLYKAYGSIRETEKSVLRINCRKLYNYFERFDEPNKGVELKHNYGIEKIIIGEKCEQLPGSYFQEYIPLIVEAPNPPELVSDFTRLAYDKTSLVVVPDESLEIYRNHEKWGKFKNIMAQSEYDASLSLNEPEESSIPDFRIENGELVCDGEPTDDLCVYTADGRMIFRGRDARIAVPEGVIILRCGNQVRKFISK